MLGSADIVAFVPTRDRAKARRFYEAVLGLHFVSEDPFAIVFDANGVTIRVVDISGIERFEPAPFTILGWNVPNAQAAARHLTEQGVKFERFPGMQQDSAGIWDSPGGARVAWFKDPDGNILSISQA
jgi:catechol 2,3-dioxygenase-like lactoylglutathione lyase family enzyme